MTLLDQIDEARRALEELTTDEAELSRLLAEQTAGIRGLKDAGSRDFALLANLEGKRAALATMLTEQRARIASVQTQLSALEATKLRGEHVEQLRGYVKGLQDRKQATDGLLIELRTFLGEQLAKVTASRVVWNEYREAAQEYAALVFGLHPLDHVGFNEDPTRAAWVQAFEEIGPGSETALTLMPHERPVRGMAQPYERPGRQSHQSEVYVIQAAQQPLLRYLDRAVMLTVAEAVEEANRLASRPLSGGE